MNERRVRFVVRGDLHRSRLTVAPRLLLAIPHIVWWWLWSVASIVVAVVGWFAALTRGSLPNGLHSFLAAYTRYATHFFAYVSLTANPYPGFVGAPGYPIDLEIDGPQPQRRLTIAFRLFLGVPVLILIAALLGAWSGGKSGEREQEGYVWATGTGVVWTIAVLGWFASLARGRMPRGFRNVNAYALRFNAEGLAYLLLLAQRYPDADPRLPAELGGPPPHPVRIDVNDDLHRSRLTVLFRLFLSLPHLVWLILWTSVALLAAIANWAATLVRGTSPAALHRFLAAYVRYSAHVGSFLFLVANPFPGFTGAPGYPVEIEIDAPLRQNRWVTGFRAILALPAVLVSGALETLLVVGGILGWFAALATGRMPQSLRNLGAYAIRYSAQTGAYSLLLTDRYPFSGPPVREATQPPLATTP